MMPRNFRCRISFAAIAFLPGLVAAQPTLTSLQPAAAPVGTVVTLTGTGFNATPTVNVVYFGGVPAPCFRPRLIRSR